MILTSDSPTRDTYAMKRKPTKNKSRDQRQAGFTLIEILAALGIVAVGISAITQLATQSIRGTTRVEERVLSNWVAANRMAQFRLDSRVTLPTGGGENKQVKMGGREWIINEVIAPTETPGTVRVEVKVYTEEDTTTPAATLASFVVKRL